MCVEGGCLISISKTFNPCLCLIQTPFNAFANKSGLDQGLLCLLVAIWYTWSYTCGPLFYVATGKFIYIIIHCGWSLAWIFIKERVETYRQRDTETRRNRNNYTIRHVWRAIVARPTFWYGTTWKVKWNSIILRDLGDSCIQNFHLGRYIVGYTVGNLVLRRRASGAVKRDFRTYIRRIYLPKWKFWIWLSPF